MLPRISTRALVDEAAPDADQAKIEEADAARDVLTAQLMAIFCQVMVVLGMLMMAKDHFGNLQLGLAAATMYLM